MKNKHVVEKAIPRVRELRELFAKEETSPMPKDSLHKHLVSSISPVGPKAIPTVSNSPSANELCFRRAGGLVLKQLAPGLGGRAAWRRCA